MTTPPADVVDWLTPPTGLDTIAADLRSLRAAAGEPSYTEIARRIAVARAARGVPERERRVSRSTLYDCFRDGRRRMSSDVVTEIAAWPDAHRGGPGLGLRHGRRRQDPAGRVHGV